MTGISLAADLVPPGVPVTGAALARACVDLSLMQEAKRQIDG